MGSFVASAGAIERLLARMVRPINVFFDTRPLQISKSVAVSGGYVVEIFRYGEEGWHRAATSAVRGAIKTESCEFGCQHRTRIVGAM
jgi:hypothetical protein